MFYQKMWFRFSFQINVFILWKDTLALNLRRCLAAEAVCPRDEGNTAGGGWSGAEMMSFWGNHDQVTDAISIICLLLSDLSSEGRTWIPTEFVWMSHWQVELHCALCKCSHHPSGHPTSYFLYDIEKNSPDVTSAGWSRSLPAISQFASMTRREQKDPSPLWPSTANPTSV